MRDIRIAVAVFNAPIGELESNFNRMAELIKESVENNAQLICFPEMNLTGYCSDSSVKKFAITLKSNYIESLSQLSKLYNVTILTGIAEKDSHGNIYASHLVLSPRKKMGVYRKLHISPPEKKTYSKGNSVPVFNACGIKFGIQLCYDAHFPELSAAMTESGIDAIFIPHASPRLTPIEKFNSWMRHLTARAFDNSIFIIACNQCGENKNNLSFPGVSIVLDPSGNVIEKDISGEEGLLYANLTKKMLNNVRSHKMKYFFPNRRHKLYQR